MLFIATSRLIGYPSLTVMQDLNNMLPDNSEMEQDRMDEAKVEVPWRPVVPIKTMSSAASEERKILKARRGNL